VTLWQKCSIGIWYIQNDKHARDDNVNTESKVDSVIREAWSAEICPAVVGCNQWYSALDGHGLWGHSQKPRHVRSTNGKGILLQQSNQQLDTLPQYIIDAMSVNMFKSWLNNNLERYGHLQLQVQVQVLQIDGCGKHHYIPVMWWLEMHSHPRLIVDWAGQGVTGVW